MQQQSKMLFFYSCHPSDEIVSDKLAQFFRPLVRDGYLEQWSVQQILPGTKVLQERKQAFESATCILLLLSAEYVASEMHYEEMLLALERHKNGTSVIPIVVRPVLFPKELETSLSSCLPENGRPVSTWKKREDALFDVAQTICQTLRLPLSIRHRSSSDSDRDFLLDTVFSMWIEGFLEPALHGKVPLAVHMQEVVDAVGNPVTRVNPWHEEVQELRRVFRPFPPEISILQAYDEAYGELLILGEPGAGKTIALLELTRLLLKRAEKGERVRIPIVFPLSSWAKEKQALEKWLVEELVRTYRLSRRDARQLIDNKAILPLLDGLDEVAESARADCVHAIETYRTEVQREIVVCCRRKEYFALPKRLTLQRAVSLQPLTNKQIEYYIQQAERTRGLSLQNLRQAFQTDSELNELAQQPLMLSIFTLTYQDTGAVELPTKSTFEAKLHLIFSNFIERMLTRRGGLRTGTREQFRKRLTFIATQLGREQETLLTVDYLQPTWLSFWSRHTYWWSVRLSIGFISFFLFETFFVLPISLTGNYLSSDFRFNLLISLGIGICASLLSQRRVGLPSKNVSWKFWILGAQFEPSLNKAIMRTERQRIRPTEILDWSWKSMSKAGLFTGLAFGLGTGLPAMIFGMPLYGIGAGLCVGVVAASSSILIYGARVRKLSEQGDLFPNQAIWQSARNGLVVGGVGGLILGLTFGLPLGISDGLRLGLLDGLAFGLFFAWFVGLVFGLLIGQLAGVNAFIQHFILRFWLWYIKSLPWNLIAFLDEATERLLLRKVGGSFIFIHRALQDYLATLETSKDEM